MKALRAAVMALTLSLVPSLAIADEAPASTAALAAPSAEAPVAPEPAPAPAGVGTPLAPRPSKPLTLASTNEGTPFGYKLIAGIGVIAAAGLWLRKKRGTRSTAPASRVDVLARTSVGVRSELLVVEVEGTRLLVGMTPSAIQTLAVLDGEAEASTEASEAPATVEAPERERRSVVPAPERPVRDVADRARALLGAMRAPHRPAVAAPKRTAVSGTGPKIPRVAGQAKGLLLALDKPDDARAEPRTAPDRPVRLGDW
ncbi:MAG: hypothetical protein BGO98_26275 [Myxococcales bacterium 68-20]|nr:MAG: hypothetical protein BGO98_26275 [Myxococcales bacterium 68-20]